jgi:hypothetical protein
LRKRVYAPVADAVELDGSRPYDLRHAFCSLLIAEELSVVEIVYGARKLLSGAKGQDVASVARPLAKRRGRR